MFLIAPAPAHFCLPFSLSTYQISKLNKRRTLTSPHRRGSDVTGSGTTVSRTRTSPSDSVDTFIQECEDVTEQHSFYIGKFVSL